MKDRTQNSQNSVLGSATAEERASAKKFFSDHVSYIRMDLGAEKKSEPTPAPPDPASDRIVEYKAFVIDDPERTTTFTAETAAEDVEWYHLPPGTEFAAGVTALNLLSSEQHYYVGRDAMENIDGLGWEEKGSCIAVEGLNEAGEVVVRHEFQPFDFDRAILEHPEEHFPTFYLGSKEFTEEELELRGETSSDKSESKYSFSR